LRDRLEEGEGDLVLPVDPLADTPGVASFLLQPAVGIADLDAVPGLAHVIAAGLGIVHLAGGERRAEPQQGQQRRGEFPELHDSILR